MPPRHKLKAFGRMLQDARLARGLTQRELAGELGLRSGNYIGMIEAGLIKGVGLGRLQEIADILGVYGVERYRWMAAAEHLPAPLWYALMRNPERWDQVLTLLSKRTAKKRSAKKTRARRR